jgi:hypothetical protein
MSKKKTTAKPTTFRSNTPIKPLVFTKKNYLFMGIGLACIILGMLLMLGGEMPNPDTWDESLIYSHRRITIAPLFIVIGLIIEIYAIFLKDPKVNE